MKKFLYSPLFMLGLVIRIVLFLTLLPHPVVEWYAPFMDSSSSLLTLDPWTAWLSKGGSLKAFPYGYAMWIFFLPLALVCKIFGLVPVYGIGMTLVLADFYLLNLFQKILPGRERLVLIAYWLSPIVIIASYVLGFNDLIPVLLLATALYHVKKSNFAISGLILSAAVSAKISMLLALPFFLIYLLRNPSLKQFFIPFVRSTAIGFVIFFAPFLISAAGVQMLFGNPEIQKVFTLAIRFGDSLLVYIVPLIYLLMLYAVWRVRRLNFELFNAVLGLAFMLVVLLTPSSPGWFLWSIPLLVLYQAASGRMSMILTGFFSFFYALSSLLVTFHKDLSFGYPMVDEKLISILHTAVIASGIILAVRIWRETVTRNDFFRLSRKPFVLGIAGDSGSGKDTFAKSLTDLFGSHSVTNISGDDYHLWDRKKPMWQVMTHLNPMANDLKSFAGDLIALTDGKSIHSKHYDHTTGLMSHPFQVKSNDIIIASGLHALYLPILRDCYNLSIYLDINEELRRHFKFQRDVNERGHTAEKVLSSFEKREPDSVQFIRPQARYADLILSLQPIHPRMLTEHKEKNPLRFKITAQSKYGLNEVALTRVLVGICGLHVDMEDNVQTGHVELTIEGETTAEDIALSAQIVCPRILEFLDTKPLWQDGVLGLMQLITISHINQALTRRII